MGRDKATIVVGGASLAERAAAVLREVTAPVIAVGPDAGSGLSHVEDPRNGPLVAFDFGSRAIADMGHDGPLVLLACDMPLVTAESLRALMAARHGADATIPIADGMLQPLSAVYAPRARAVAARLVQEGARSMRDLLAAIRIEVLPVDTASFADIDEPEDLERVAPLLETPA